MKENKAPPTGSATSTHTHRDHHGFGMRSPWQCDVPKLYYEVPILQLLCLPTQHRCCATQRMHPEKKQIELALSVISKEAGIYPNYLIEILSSAEQESLPILFCIYLETPKKLQ